MNKAPLSTSLRDCQHSSNLNLGELHEISTPYFRNSSTTSLILLLLLRHPHNNATVTGTPGMFSGLPASATPRVSRRECYGVSVILNALSYGSQILSFFQSYFLFIFAPFHHLPAGPNALSGVLRS